ncbi:MAG: hypothetical protein PWP38_1188 [Clostridiales bacterium]|nr:hypothetical protein [Clostridiales bacterium]
MKQIKGKLFLFAAFTLAGTSVISGYYLSNQLGSFTIIAVSICFVMLALLPIYGRKCIRAMHTMSFRDWMMIFLQAFFGIFMFRTFLLYGMKRTTAIEAGILTGTTPAITSLMAFFILRERFSIKTVIGILSTVLGIMLLQNLHLIGTNFPAAHLKGNLLVICAAACESTFNIISRKHRSSAIKEKTVSLHPMVQTLFVSAVALILSFIPAAFEQPINALSVLSIQAWLSLFWYGVIATAVSFAFFYEGVKRCDAYTTAAFSGLMPLTAMLLSIFLFKDSLQTSQCIGSALIILSMILIGSNSSEEAANLSIEVS